MLGDALGNGRGRRCEARGAAVSLLYDRADDVGAVLDGHTATAQAHVGDESVDHFLCAAEAALRLF